MASVAENADLQNSSHFPLGAKAPPLSPPNTYTMLVEAMKVILPTIGYNLQVSTRFAHANGDEILPVMYPSQLFSRMRFARALSDHISPLHLRLPPN